MDVMGDHVIGHRTRHQSEGQNRQDSVCTAPGSRTKALLHAQMRIEERWLVFIASYVIGLFGNTF